MFKLQQNDFLFFFGNYQNFIEKYGFENDQFCTVVRREPVIFLILCYRYILYFRQSGSWEILSASVNESDVIVFRRNTTKEIYSQIDITFTIKRNPGLFVLNTIIPTVTSSYLSLVTFIVPAGSGEKTTFAVGAMVVQAILMTLFFNQVPGASTSTSIFCKLM